MILIGVGWLIRVLNQMDYLSDFIKLGAFYLLALVLLIISLVIKSSKVVRYTILSVAEGIAALTTLAGVTLHDVFNQYVGFGVLIVLLLISVGLSLKYKSEYLMAFFSVIAIGMESFLLRPAVNFPLIATGAITVILFAVPLIFGYFKKYFWSTLIAYLALARSIELMMGDFGWSQVTHVMFLEVMFLVLIAIILIIEIITRFKPGSAKFNWATWGGNGIIALHVIWMLSNMPMEFIIPGMIGFLLIVLVDAKDHFRNEFYLALAWVCSLFIFPISFGYLNLTLVAELATIVTLLIGWWLKAYLIPWAMLLVSFVTSWSILISTYPTDHALSVQIISLVAVLIVALINAVMSRFRHNGLALWHALAGIVLIHVLLIVWSTKAAIDNSWIVLALLYPLLVLRVIMSGRHFMQTHTRLMYVLQAYIAIIQVFVGLTGALTVSFTLPLLVLFFAYFLIDFAVTTYMIPTGVGGKFVRFPLYFDACLPLFIIIGQAHHGTLVTLVVLAGALVQLGLGAWMKNKFGAQIPDLLIGIYMIPWLWSVCFASYYLFNNNLLPMYVLLITVFFGCITGRWTRPFNTLWQWVDSLIH